jgi:asparagine synthase (glutamine-hydrolysing)
MGAILVAGDSDPGKALQTMNGALSWRGNPTHKIHTGDFDPLGFACYGSTGTIASAENNVAVVCDSYFTNRSTHHHETAVLNGESKEAAITDAHFVVELYRRHGLDFLRHLQGAFALALWDPQERHLILARDPWGIRPLFYTFDESHWAAASDIKAILQLPWVTREINAYALQSILSSQTNYFSETFFRKIYKLVPGTYLILQDGKRQERSYRNLEWSEDASLTEEAASEKLHRLFSDSVSRWTRNGNRYAALLSGGLDSSAVVAYFSRNHGYAPKTFTTGYGADDPEAIFAAKVASAFNASHQFLKVTGEDIASVLHQVAWALEEPLCMLETVPLYIALKHIAEEHDTVLAGDTADGIFAGARRHKVLLSWLPLPVFVKRDFYMKMFLGISPEAKTSQAAQSLYWHGERFVMPLLADGAYFTAYRSRLDEITGATTGSLLRDLLRFEMEHELPNYVLTRTNRLTEINGLDARIPFVDDEIYRFAARLPDNFRIRRWKEKWILRRATEGSLPKAVARRPKLGQQLGFDVSLARQLERLGAQFIKSGRFQSRNLFDLGTIELALRRGSDAPYPGKQAHAIWTLLLFEIVARLFIDAKPSSCPPKLEELQ